MKRLILVIEDDINICNKLFDILRQKGFNMISADDGVLGLQLAEDMEPDLILCDIDLPIFNGYEILKQLRDNPRTAIIPLIFIISETDWGGRSQAMQLGVREYLTKPVNFTRLLAAIDRQLAKIEPIR
jgi:DNA-binding response OmpR family regulator